MFIWIVTLIYKLKMIIVTHAGMTSGRHLYLYTKYYTKADKHTCACACGRTHTKPCKYTQRTQRKNILSQAHICKCQIFTPVHREPCLTRTLTIFYQILFELPQFLFFSSNTHLFIFSIPHLFIFSIPCTSSPIFLSLVLYLTAKFNLQCLFHGLL